MSTKDTTPDETTSEFTFTGPDGTEHTLAATLDTLTPGYMRRHRSMPGAEFNLMLFEALADDAALEAFDAMTWAENSAMMKEFEQHLQTVLGAAVGESGGSSSSSTSTKRPSNAS